MTHPLVGLILTQHGDVANDGACPSCGAASKYRVASASFGTFRYAVCSKCGHELINVPSPDESPGA